MAQEGATGTGHRDLSLGRYWLGHAWLAALLPGYVMVLVGVFFFGVAADASGLLSLAEAEGIATAVENAYVAVWSLGAVVAYFVAAFGYYVEASRLRESGAEWRPRWRLYLAFHLLLPVVAAPAYLIQRWRHVGLR